jgi:hypothetical protein
MSTPLIVSFSYGFEHEIFHCMKDIWATYRRFVRDAADLVFIRTSSEYEPEQYSYAHGEYVFGPSLRPLTKQDSTPTGWNLTMVVDRQLKFYRKLLETQRSPFWLFAATVTSAIDIRALRLLVDQMECKACLGGAIEYAGIPPGMGPDFPAGQYLRFVSGAGTLLSSDLIALTLERASMVDQQMQNDLWLALVLRDIPRTPLMRYDITNITAFDSTSRSNLATRIAQARAQGHFYFRVRSGRWEPEGQLQHNPTLIDTLVLNDILLTLHASPFDPATQLAGWQQAVRQVSDSEGQRVLAIGGPPQGHD